MREKLAKNHCKSHGRAGEVPVITSACSSLRGSFNRRNPAPIQPPYVRRAGKTMNASNGHVGTFGMNPIVSCLNRIVRENTGSRFFNWVIQRSSVVERSAVNRLVVGSNPTAGANRLRRLLIAAGLERNSFVLRFPVPFSCPLNPRPDCYNFVSMKRRC